MTIFTVTNTLDSGTGSLRDAIASANSTVGADVINMAGVSGTIILSTGLSITDSVSLNGSDPSQLTISGNNAVRVLDISGTVTVNINSLTIANGSLTNTDGAGIRVGIGSSLGLSNSTISGNTATQALPVSTYPFGGGIHNQGTVTITNSTIRGNSAGYGAGISNFGTSASLTVTNSNISGNFGYQGGGIYNYKGTVAITNSTISGHSVIADGAGLYNRLGTMTVTNSTVSNNIVSGSGNNRGGGIFNNRGILKVDNSTISGNRTGNQGGGIASNGAGSTLTLMNSTLSGNTSNGFGGAIATDKIIVISNSTLGGNSAATGGAINNNGGTVTISNSTLSGNRGQKGGAIANGATVTINNSTLTGNSATAKGGSVYQNGGATIAIASSIVAGNTSPSQAETEILSGTFTSKGNNLVGQNGNAGGFTTVASDILLAGSISSALTPLANNGGPTATHALVFGGPAIDKGSNPNNLATDQRGFARLYGLATDIGAFEWHPTEPDPIPEAAIAISDRAQGGIPDGTVQPLIFGWVAGATEGSGEVINQRTFEISNKGDAPLYLSDLRFEIDLPSLPPGVAPADVFQIKFLSRNPIEPGAAALVEVALNPNLPPWFYRANFVVKTNVSSVPFYNFPVEAIVPKPPIPTVEEAVATLFPVPVVSGTAQGNVLLGSNASEILQGFQGDDTVFGLKGNDLVLGGQGNDQLFGGQGNDWLFGKEGDDVLYGDFGNDSLIGGEGKDLFVLGKSRGSDIIFDYEDGVDSFLLEPGLTFDQLSFSQVSSSTQIWQGSELLATVQGIPVSVLEISDFGSLSVWQGQGA